ncbi:MAG TPA: hypothetical protein VE973_03530 [Candidatus Limnocylindria bacterium]|nr:hypothetical protein [Candidatus Limnocylindria bacterium]
MNNKQRNLIIGILIIVVVALISYATYRYNNGLSIIGDWGNWEQNTPSTGNPAPETSSSTPPATKLSYSAAVNTYKYRFQFSQCHGTPGTISVKAGQPVMLDNRDATAHTIKANGQSFRIAAHDYAVIYPYSITKGNVDLTLSNVSCDGGGAATLNVEK